MQDDICLCVTWIIEREEDKMEGLLVGHLDNTHVAWT
jgi:hypothetical protein